MKSAFFFAAWVSTFASGAILAQAVNDGRQTASTLVFNEVNVQGNAGSINPFAVQILQDHVCAADHGRSGHVCFRISKSHALTSPVVFGRPGGALRMAQADCGLVITDSAGQFSDHCYDPGTGEFVGFACAAARDTQWTAGETSGGQTYDGNRCLTRDGRLVDRGKVMSGLGYGVGFADWNGDGILDAVTRKGIFAGPEFTDPLPAPDFSDTRLCERVEANGSPGDELLCIGGIDRVGGLLVLHIRDRGSITVDELSAQWNYSRFPVADFNGDGLSDYVDGLTGKVYLGNGSGFDYETSLPLPDLPHPQSKRYAATGDMNDDGVLDICMTGSPVACWLTQRTNRLGNSGSSPVHSLAENAATATLAKTRQGPTSAAPKRTRDKDKERHRLISWQMKSFYAECSHGSLQCWLYDRVQLVCRWAEIEQQYRSECIASARWYLENLKRQGQPGWPDCGGGFQGAGVNPCDAKFYYTPTALFWLRHHGEEVTADLEFERQVLLSFGWMGQAIAPITDESNFTERNWGVAINGLVYLHELGLDTSADLRAAATYLRQRQLEKGSGWILHSWSRHENTEIEGNPQCASPWMSNMLHYAMVRAAKIVPEAQEVADAIAVEAKSTALYDKPWNADQRGSDVVRYVYCPDRPDIERRWHEGEGWNSNAHLPEIISMTGNEKLWRKLGYLRSAQKPARIAAWQHYGVW